MTLIHLKWHLILRWLLRSIFTRFSEQLLKDNCILRKSWRVFHDILLLGRCSQSFLLPVWEYCSAVWCSAADTHLKLLDRAVSGSCFLTTVCLNVTLHIIYMWRYYVWCIRSGVIRCTLFMVLYLYRAGQCGLQALIWSHIGILMRILAVELCIYSTKTFICLSVSQ